MIHDQTQAFLDENKILYRFQSGFRKHFSTDSCLSYLNNKIATGFESGLHTGMILIDLQKAFYTINHEILINKMEFLGFSKEVILWFKSYLSYRKFKVNLKVTSATNIFLPQNSSWCVMNFFIWRKNVSFLRYLDFRIFVKSKIFKICGVMKEIST